MPREFVETTAVAVLFCLTLVGLYQAKAHDRRWGTRLVLFLVIPLGGVLALAHSIGMSGARLVFGLVSTAGGLGLAWLGSAWLPARWHRGWRGRLLRALLIGVCVSPLIFAPTDSNTLPVLGDWLQDGYEYEPVGGLRGLAWRLFADPKMPEPFGALVMPAFVLVLLAFPFAAAVREAAIAVAPGMLVVAAAAFLVQLAMAGWHRWLVTNAEAPEPSGRRERSGWERALGFLGLLLAVTAWVHLALWGWLRVSWGDAGAPDARRNPLYSCEDCPGRLNLRWSRFVPVFIAHGADVNEEPEMDDTPLNRALSFAGGGPTYYRPHRDTAKALLAAGAKVVCRQRDLIEHSPLHMAASEDDGELCRLLVAAGAEVNLEIEGRTPLEQAATLGRPEALRALLAAGADVNYVSEWTWRGRTALYQVFAPPSLPGLDLLDKEEQMRWLARGAWGGQRGRDQALEILLAAGADPSGALALAARDGNMRAVRLLLAHGCDPAETLSAAWRVTDAQQAQQWLEFWVAAGVRLDGLLRSDVTVPPVMVKALLTAGVPLNTPDARGRTVLDCVSDFDREIAELLRAAGAKTGDELAAAHGTPALHQAIAARDCSRVKELLAAGAAVGARDWRGRTALHLAAARPQDADLVGILLAAGGDVRTVDAAGRTALHNAAESWNPAAVRGLLAAGALPNARENSGSTALDYVTPRRCLISAWGGVKAYDPPYGMLYAPSYDVEREETTFGAPLACAAAIRAAGGQTSHDLDWPLHAAAARGDLETVRRLLREGQRCDRFDDVGRTPLGCAAAANQTGVIEVLLAAGAKVRHLWVPPLQDAASTGAVEAMRLLLAAHADPNDHGGREDLSPLLLAAYRGDARCTQLLLKANAKAVGQGEVECPLEAACMPLPHRDTEAAQALPESERAAALAAMRTGRQAVVRLLLAAGVEINHPHPRADSSREQTALDLAIESNDPVIIELLRKHGAKTAAELKAAGP